MWYVIAKRHQKLYIYPCVFQIILLTHFSHVKIASKLAIWKTRARYLIGMRNISNNCTFGMGVTYMLAFVFHLRIKHSKTVTLLVEMERFNHGFNLINFISWTYFHYVQCWALRNRLVHNKVCHHLVFIWEFNLFFKQKANFSFQCFFSKYREISGSLHTY